MTGAGCGSRAPIRLSAPCCPSLSIALTRDAPRASPLPRAPAFAPCRAQINADDNDDFRALCTELIVREVPAFRLFRGGEEVMAPQLRLMPPGLKAAEKVLRATLKEFAGE